MRSRYSILSWKKAEASTGWRGASRPLPWFWRPKASKPKKSDRLVLRMRLAKSSRLPSPSGRVPALAMSASSTLAGGDRPVVVLVVDRIQFGVPVLDGEADPAQADAVAPRRPALDVEAHLVLVGVGLARQAAADSVVAVLLLAVAGGQVARPGKGEAVEIIRPQGEPLGRIGDESGVDPGHGEAVVVEHEVVSEIRVEELAALIVETDVHLVERPGTEEVDGLEIVQTRLPLDLGQTRRIEHAVDGGAVAFPIRGGVEAGKAQLEGLQVEEQGAIETDALRAGVIDVARLQPQGDRVGDGLAFVVLAPVDASAAVSRVDQVLELEALPIGRREILHPALPGQESPDPVAGHRTAQGDDLVGIAVGVGAEPFIIS